MVHVRHVTVNVVSTRRYERAIVFSKRDKPSACNSLKVRRIEFVMKRQVLVGYGSSPVPGDRLSIHGIKGVDLRDHENHELDVTDETLFVVQFTVGSVLIGKANVPSYEEAVRLLKRVASRGPC